MHRTGKGRQRKEPSLGAIKRIGILTGGGDCPGLNAVIRAVTRSAHGAGMEVVGIMEGFGGLVNGLWRLLDEKDVTGILPRGGTILGTSNRDNPFNYCVRYEGDQPIFEDCSEVALENLEKMGVEALVVVGGDGSLHIALGLSDRGARVVGVPKTIDNDVGGTDVTFGFDSAVITATEAIDKLHTTAESHHRVMVLEVMGRNSGWIALMAGMAGGGDVILIPEIPFTFVGIAASISERRERGKRFSIIVVAEGAVLPGGEPVSRVSAAGTTILGGVGEVVAREVEARASLETRVTVLGHLQRGGSPSPFDRNLATRFGVKAVELILDGKFGMMTSLRTPDIGHVPIAEAVAARKTVPPDGDLVSTARAVGTSFGD